MKTSIYKILFPILLGSATSAIASVNNSGLEGDGMLVWLFISFGAMVLLIQVVPAIVTFFSMLRGLFLVTRSEVFFSTQKSNNGK